MSLEKSWSMHSKYRQMQGLIVWMGVNFFPPSESKEKSQIGRIVCTIRKLEKNLAIILNIVQIIQDCVLHHLSYFIIILWQNTNYIKYLCGKTFLNFWNWLENNIIRQIVISTLKLGLVKYFLAGDQGSIYRVCVRHTRHKTLHTLYTSLKTQRVKNQNMPDLCILLWRDKINKSYCHVLN